LEYRRSSRHEARRANVHLVTASIDNASRQALNGERLLTARAVAELLCISSEAVLRLWRAGDLPGFRLSTRVLRFRESEIMEWLETRRAHPLPERASLGAGPVASRPSEPSRGHAR
jgi:excisionase family DNA binding protein